MATLTVEEAIARIKDVQDSIKRLTGLYCVLFTRTSGSGYRSQPMSLDEAREKARRFNIYNPDNTWNSYSAHAEDLLYCLDVQEQEV